MSTSADTHRRAQDRGPTSVIDGRTYRQTVVWRLAELRRAEPVLGRRDRVGRRLVEVVEVPVGDLVARRQPDAVVAGDVGERAVEVLQPEGEADEEGVQRDRHHESRVLGRGVQAVELVD